MGIKVILKKIRRNRREIKKVLLLLLVIVILFVTFRYLLSCGNSNNVISSELYDGRVHIEIDGKKYVQRDDLDMILVIGIDKNLEDITVQEASTKNNQQSDFLFLIILNNTDETYSVLQINRDTMTAVRELGINGKVIKKNVEQICLARTYGSGGKDSCRNTMDAVQNLLLGIKIDYFISFTMDVVPIAADSVGGVKVLIEDEFPEETGFALGTEVTLKGDDALTYVRSRSGMIDDQSNTARMKRQRTFINAFKDAAIAKMEDSERWAADTIVNMSDYLVTNFTSSELTSLADVLKNYKQSEDIYTLSGETVIVPDDIQGEVAEFHYDKEACEDMVLKIFFEPED